MRIEFIGTTDSEVDRTLTILGNGNVILKVEKGTANEKAIKRRG